MSNVVIGGTATGATALPVASTIDGTLDLLPIYTASATATQAISRSTLLGVTGQPADLSSVQNFSNKVVGNTNTITAKDSLLTVQNAADTTKQAKLSLSGLTTGTTRTYTLPDVSDTLVTLGATQILAAKTLTNPIINSPNITNATITADTLSGYTVSGTGTIYGLSVAGGAITTSGYASSTALQTNAVQGNQLSATAIKLASPSITANITTTSTTAVQATGLTATVTIPAGGRSIKISFFGNLQVGTGVKNPVVSIWDGVVASGTQLASSSMVIQNAGISQFFVCYAVVTPSAGSKTYNIGWMSDGGGGVTTTMVASATSPALMIVEVI